MPIYRLRCTKCNFEFEKITNWENLSNCKCQKCNSDTEVIPSTVVFKINGYSADNGYHRETINYDGSRG